MPDRATTGQVAPARTGVMGATTLVVGSGKGGVGKSLVSIWLAAALADLDRHTLLYDAVPVLPSLDHLLGTPPARNSADILWRGTALGQQLHRLSASLWLLPGDADVELLHSLPPDDRARLQRRLWEQFRLFDVVVIDAGPDPDSIVRSLTLGGDALVVVTTPDPPSIRESYRLIKVAVTASPVTTVEVVVNRARSAAEGADAFAALQRTSVAVLVQELRLLGVILEDPGVATAVGGGRAGLERLARTTAGRSLARQLANLLGGSVPSPQRREAK
ncbi:MAG TPA: P-loop NTPase [Gemmatimonadales bacterium]|nr:P-loop NTPase [Gemmatimonadales bacterium]